jgi:hypothetical protein
MPKCNRQHHSSWISDTHEKQCKKYEVVSKSFRTGLPERELQIVQLPATRCSCIAIFVSQSSEFCRHNPLCCFSVFIVVSVYFVVDSVWKLLDYLLLFIPLSLRTEHRASTVPRHPRLLLQFLGSFTDLVGLLGEGISPAQGLYLHRTTQHRNTQTNNHAPSRIRTCDPNVRAAEDSTCLRPRGHWDRLNDGPNHHEMHMCI